MKNKKICLVVASPLTIKFFLLGSIEMLAKQCDLTVITNADDTELLAHLGVPVRVIPVVIERNVSVWRDLKALIRLVVIFAKERFDMVHTLSPKSGLLGIVAGWIVRIPVRIHTFQGEVWITRKGFWRAFLKFLDKVVARLSTHLLVVSESEEKFLVEQGVVPSGRLHMIANGSICGVDTERFKPDAGLRKEMREAMQLPQTEIVILYMGRLNRDKGLLDLADAFAKVSANYPQAHLLLVGPDEEDMQNKITARCGQGLSRLHFAGYTNMPERYMAAADIFCLPSYREGFGLVLIEAAATGIPTIGSNIYGITDAMVDRQTGLLFSVGDVNDLAEKMERLIKDAALRRELGDRGRARACEEFSKELVLSELLKYYEKL